MEWLRVIKFDPETSLCEVQGRMGIFSLLFVASFAMVFVLSGGYRELPAIIMGCTTLLILMAFAVRDAMLCKRVSKALVR